MFFKELIENGLDSLSSRFCRGFGFYMNGCGRIIFMRDLRGFSVWIKGFLVAEGEVVSFFGSFRICV